MIPAILDELGLGHHRERFEAEKIDREALLACSDADLQSLGVVALGERKKLLAWRAAATAHTVQSSSGPSAAARGAPLDTSTGMSLRLRLALVPLAMVVPFGILRVLQWSIGGRFMFLSPDVWDAFVRSSFGRDVGAGTLAGAVVSCVLLAVAWPVVIGRLSGVQPARGVIARFVVAALPVAALMFAIELNGAGPLCLGLAVGVPLAVMLPRTGAALVAASTCAVVIEFVVRMVPSVWDLGLVMAFRVELTGLPRDVIGVGVYVVVLGVARMVLQPKFTAAGTHTWRSALTEIARGNLQVQVSP